ncbi:MAG: CRTAC1 family protein [Alphaproteobacteria bacterium]
MLKVRGRREWSLTATLALFIATPSLPLEAPRFVEETATAGIVHKYDGGWEFFVGGGVAVFDCNADGRPDLYFASGADKTRLFRNASATGGALRFEPVPDGPLALMKVTGAYPLDVDGDGTQDLAVLRVGENVLYRGLGDCRFARANEAWEFSGGDAWSTAFSARWERGRAWPTLAVGNYVDRDAPGAPWGTCHDNALYRPAADGGGFAPPIALAPGHCALSVLVSDWNRSGDADLRISNDRQYYRGGAEQLWRLPPGSPPSLYTRANGWRKLAIWGMGITSYDVTGDGYPEYYLTSMGDNKLRTLSEGAARPRYRDIARKRGVTAQRPFAGGEIKPSTAWHAEFRDVNNDGFIDLFVAKGNVEAMKDAAARDPNNLLLGRPDGRFEEAAASAGIVSFKRARGAALVDLNLDGLPDLVVVNRRENVQLWRNVGAGTAERPRPLGNWLQLKLAQSGGNRDAVGAWIKLSVGGRTLRREVTVGGGHAGGASGWIHFGLGTAERTRVRVQWPHGAWGPWISLLANRFVRITRGAGQAAVWLPPPDE